MTGTGQVKTALVENLKELHLRAMLACFEDTARRAEKETFSYEQYLLELSERECEQRRGNRIRRLLQDSGLLFPHPRLLLVFGEFCLSFMGKND